MACLQCSEINGVCPIVLLDEAADALERFAAAIARQVRYFAS